MLMAIDNTHNNCIPILDKIIEPSFINTLFKAICPSSRVYPYVNLLMTPYNIWLSERKQKKKINKKKSPTDRPEKLVLK